jgi:UDP-2,3-diacylglucosamine pyrophosphatase LpxH
LSQVRHTVVISDVHLCEAVEGDGLWMRYRQRRFFPDGELGALLDLLCSEARGGTLELVFNGDLFDFDAPAAAGRGEVHFDDPPRSEPVAVAVLARILDDHAGFVAAVGRVLAAGHRVVVVSGNHDAQLVYPGVRALLAERFVAAACAAGAAETEAALRARLVFRAWFHRTADGVHIEHGNQYDPFCAFSSPVEPFAPDGGEIQPTMGSLSFRHLVSRMGYFNPHVDSSFMLSLPGYFSHWVRYYLFSHRSLAGAWAAGALRVVAGVMRGRRRGDPALRARAVDAAARETGTDPRALARHAALFAPTSGEVPHAVVRELWLDRAALGTLGAGVLLAAAVVGPRTAARWALGVAGTIAAYELAMPKRGLEDIYARVARSAEQIAEIHGARAVVFGHTHQPYGRWAHGVFQGNSGTWSAAFRDVECSVPVDDGRPVIWLRAGAHAGLEGGLYVFRNGHLVEGASRPAAAEPSALVGMAGAGVGTA